MSPVRKPKVPKPTEYFNAGGHYMIPKREEAEEAAAAATAAPAAFAQKKSIPACNSVKCKTESAGPKEWPRDPAWNLGNPAEDVGINDAQQQKPTPEEMKSDGAAAFAQKAKNDQSIPACTSATYPDCIKDAKTAAPETEEQKRKVVEYKTG